MLFWLKKLIGYCLMPVPVCVGLLVIGCVLLLWTKRTRLGRTLILTGTLLFALFSNQLFSGWLVRPLENRYPPIPELVHGRPIPPALAACRYVIVLGSGNGNTAGRASLNQLSVSARARLTEAVRLLRVLPEAQLVMSGPAEKKHPSHAVVLARAAIALGIEENRIALIEQVRDTEDESLAVRRRVGDAPVALVTTAWHMPRAMALFRHAGLTAVACPTDYTATDDGEWDWVDLLFDVESLGRSTAGIRERLGYAWIWLRGKG
jgi:uncharacterized SAM-binding protein YcdF (DUF218 family)